MGAWGHGLFQSDHDFDIVSELTDEAGLYKVEEEDAKKKGVKTSDAAENDDSEYMSLYFPSNPELVRKHMDSGVLVKMLDEYLTKLLSGETEDFFRHPGYIFMLLGACAMTLGCTVPAKFKTAMQKVYTCVNLPSDGVKQMKKALMGPDGFQDGVPYDFNSKGLIETANSNHEPRQTNAMGVIGMNVHGPGTLFYQPPKGSTKGLKELQAEYDEGRFPQGTCGGCGAKTGKSGGNLLTCSGCNAQMYCSKECQKKQWTAHKAVCSKVNDSADTDGDGDADVMDG